MHGPGTPDTPKTGSPKPDAPRGDDAPLVSAVIPTYQRAALIAHALDSVAAQSWRPIDAVVSDDGSDDGTETVVRDWAARHPDVPVRYLWQPNAGGNAARNAGWRAAGGAWVAFLDSDDAWHPEKTARQMARLQAGGFGAAYCGLREIDAATGAVIAEPAQRYSEGALLDALLVRDGTAPTTAWIIRRDLLETLGGFDETLRARQDWDLWIRLAARTRIAAIPERLMDLRHHDGPRTASDPSRELRAYAAIRRKNAALIRSRPLRVRAAALAACHRRSGRVHLHYMGRRGRALGHYLVAVAVWPVEPDSWYALTGWFLPGGVRKRLRRAWNRVLGRTRLGIRSH